MCVCFFFSMYTEEKKNVNMYYIKILGLRVHKFYVYSLFSCVFNRIKNYLSTDYTNNWIGGHMENLYMMLISKILMYDIVQHFQFFPCCRLSQKGVDSIYFPVPSISVVLVCLARPFKKNISFFFIFINMIFFRYKSHMNVIHYESLLRVN